MMDTALFHTKVDALLLAIEEWLEAHDTALDYETEQGILTITLPDQRKLILSRQEFMQEVWLASPKGAYHFFYQQGWRTKQNEELIGMLQNIIATQANIILDQALFKQQEK